MYTVPDRTEMPCLNKHRGCPTSYKALWLSAGFLPDGCPSFLWVALSKENRPFAAGVMGPQCF